MFATMSRRALLQFVWRMAAGGLSVAASVIIAVTLGLSTQGVLASSVSVLLALSVATGAGFSHGLAFLVARCPENARDIAIRAAILAVPLGIVTGLVAASLGSLLLGALPVFWWAVAFALPFAQLGQLGLGVSQGLGASRDYAITYVMQPAAAVAFAVVAALSDGGAGGAVSPRTPLLIAGPFVLQAATAAWTLLRLPAAPAREPFGPLLSYTARIYPSSLMHFLSYRLDLILVGALLGASAAGIYSLALNGVDAVARLGQSTATVLFPEFARPSGRSPSLARRAAVTTGLISFGASIVLVVLVLAFSTERPEVLTVGQLLMILAAGGGGVGAWTVLASFLAATDRLGAAARINLVMLAVSVALYLWLIPSVGVYGGALGTSAGLVLAALLGYREVERTAAAVVSSDDGEATRLRNPSGK